MTNLRSLLEFVLLAIPMVLLAYALVQARKAARTGGMKVQLAHVIADPKAGQRWLVSLSVVLGAFLTFGTLGAVALIWPAVNDPAEYLQVVAFVIGAVSLVLMLGSAPSRSTLTLNDELTLQENHTEVLVAVQATTHASSSGSAAGMYIVPEVPAGGGPGRPPESSAAAWP